MASEPGNKRIGAAVRQEIDHAALLEVNKNGPVAVATTPPLRGHSTSPPGWQNLRPLRPFVNAEHARRLGWCCRRPLAERVKQRHGGERHAQPVRQA